MEKVVEGFEEVGEREREEKILEGFEGWGGGGGGVPCMCPKPMEIESVRILYNHDPTHIPILMGKSKVIGCKCN